MHNFLCIFKPSDSTQLKLNSAIDKYYYSARRSKTNPDITESLLYTRGKHSKWWLCVRLWGFVAVVGCLVYLFICLLLKMFSMLKHILYISQILIPLQIEKKKYISCSLFNAAISQKTNKLVFTQVIGEIKCSKMFICRIIFFFSRRAFNVSLKIQSTTPSI